MSHLAWDLSIIIGEETKNVNENGVQVDKHGPLKHFSLFSKIQTRTICDFSRKKTLAIINIQLNETQRRPKKLMIACFLNRNTERWSVYFRQGAIFGIFV
jgi:hypothetical protein